jgi:hypothetical protein
MRREAKLAYGTAAVVIVGLGLLATPAVVGTVNEIAAIAPPASAEGLPDSDLRPVSRPSGAVVRASM